MRHLILAGAVAAVPATGLAERSPPLTIADSALVVRSEDGDLSIDARRLVFPGTVNAAAYGAARQILVAACVERLVPDPSTNALERTRYVAEWRTIAYDLAHHRVLWQAQKDLLPLAVLSNRLLALRGKKIALLELDTGEERRTFPEDALLVAQDSTLVIRDGGFVERLDLETGVPIWRTRVALMERALVEGRVAAFREDSVLYVAGAGVAAVDLANGATWQHDMDVVRSNATSTVLTNAVYIGVMLAAGNFKLPQYWGSRIETSSERPLLRGDRIYAAADTEAVCLMQATGRIRWRRRLGRDEQARIRAAALRGLSTANPPELPGRMVVRDAGDAIAVLSLGFARDRSTTVRTDRPTLALLDPETGTTRRRIRIGLETELRDYRRAGTRHLVLGPERLLVLDESLAARDTLRPPAGHREFVAFLPLDSAIVVRTNAGVLELDSEMLTTLWERNLGGGVEPEIPRDLQGWAWFAGRHGLLGRARAGDRPRTWIPYTAAAAAISDGAAITLNGSTVDIMPLPSFDR